jgi:hypothetical protein
MAKRNKKNDAEQKNKKGFDSANKDVEFSKELNAGAQSGQKK